jgi:hypothetical protein
LKARSGLAVYLGVIAALIFQAVLNALTPEGFYSLIFQKKVDIFVFFLLNKYANVPRVLLSVSILGEKGGESLTNHHKKLIKGTES